MQGRIEIINDEVSVKLPIELMKEGDKVIIYTHALDICGYGSSADEAKKDFGSALKIFFRETIENNTLEKALEELGWKKIVMDNRKYWEPQTEVISSSLEEMKFTA